jgi:hypothetical protein
LPPCLDCFNGLALVRIGLGLLLLFRGLIVLLGSFLILVFGLFNRLYTHHEFLLSEVKQSACNGIPFLLDIPFTIGINVDSFLLHQ